MTTEVATESFTVTVLAERVPAALEALKKLAAKAARYGCPDIVVTVGETRAVRTEISDWDLRERVVEEAKTDLIITGEAPRVGSHEFLARVELGGEAGNLVDTRPGVEDLDHRFRTTDGFCDHCQTRRGRNEVFVVRDLNTGEQRQIGRSCLRDYLGIDDPAKIAQRFAFWRAVAGFDEDLGRRAKADWAQSLEGALILSAVCIRLFGWCSRGQASNDPSLTPTSSYVHLVLSPPPRLEKEDRETIAKIKAALSDSDREAAAATIRWVREELNDDSDYAHNLHVLFGADSIRDAKRLGLVVSAVAGYHRAKEIELRKTKERAAAADSQHVGEVGKRLRGLKVTLQSQIVIGSNEWGDRLLVKFADEAGNTLVWFTGAGTGLEVGEAALLDGTVKEHGEFAGSKQTTLTRCKLSEIAK